MKTLVRWTAVALVSLALALGGATLAPQSAEAKPRGKVVIKCKKGQRIPGSIKRCKKPQRLKYVSYQYGTGGRWQRVR